MSKVTVLHNISRDAGFGLNQAFNGTGKFHAPSSHELVKVFEFDTSDLLDPGDLSSMSPDSRPTRYIIADVIFRAFNVGNDPMMTNPDSKEFVVATTYRARRLRSLSVGDVLVFEDWMYLACESAGWRDVPEAELRVLDAQAAEGAIRERFSFRPGEQLTVTVPLD